MAALLGAMVLLTFVNVILRYVFNMSLIWSLEVTLVLFAWFVLLGISYCVKINAHLGVDLIVNRVSPSRRRLLGLAAAAVCLAYALLLLKGAWDYWAPFAGLYETTGRWLPTGIDWNTRDRAWYETDQIPMLDFLRFLEPIINEGEEYEKLPRLVPYAALPIGAAILLYRFVRATIAIWRGNLEMLIVSHELQDSSSSQAED